MITEIIKTENFIKDKTNEKQQRRKQQKGGNKKQTNKQMGDGKTKNDIFIL